MQENHGHYIANAIRRLYRKRIIAPILYLIFVGILWAAPQVNSAIFPSRLSAVSEIEKLFQQAKNYLSAELTGLKFTGYTKTRFHRTVGYFYYTIDPDSQKGYIILLSPSTCGEGLAKLESVSIYAKILPADNSFNTLTSSLADDLFWTKPGIHSQVSPCYLSEPDFKYGFHVFLMLILSASSAYALISSLLYVLFVIYPSLAPPCRTLKYFGNKKELLALAEKELATLPQLATEDMFITEHFFIELSRYGVALVPIREIIWIYKHSTLHKLFGYHLHISYTLHIWANCRILIHCPLNIKSDIDGIMDYLAEANHNILVGFTEENRKKAREALERV